jgi:hypothetical protein
MPGACRVERRIDVRLGRGGGARDDAVGLTRVGGDDRVAGARVVADPHGDVERPTPIVLAQRVGELGTHRRAAQLEHRLVGERR